MFLTDAQLKDAVAAMLKVQPGQLDPYWDAIVADANVTAYRGIVAALRQRGYTAAEVAAWDFGPEYQRDIGLFWALTKGGGLNGYDDRFVKALDRRKELETVLLSVAGQYVRPGTPGSAVSDSGTLSTAGDAYGPHTRW